jgi:hypothetical protein
MHPVGAAGDRDVGARIDEQASGGLLLFGSQWRIFAHNTNRRAGKDFELANGKIFLAQLNEVHTATSGLRDLRKQSALASTLVTGELDAICDVEKEQALRIGLRDFGNSLARFAFMLRFRPKVVLGQTIA